MSPFSSIPAFVPDFLTVLHGDYSAEFICLLFYFYICDRTNVFGESKKVCFLIIHT